LSAASAKQKFCWPALLPSRIVAAMRGGLRRGLSALPPG
jgi:hypothetical protein